MILPLGGWGRSGLPYILLIFQLMQYTITKLLPILYTDAAYYAMYQCTFDLLAEALYYHHAIAVG